MSQNFYSNKAAEEKKNTDTQRNIETGKDRDQTQRHRDTQIEVWREIS